MEAGAFDVMTACSGWIYALSVAKAYVESGMRRKVLAIGAEALTRIVNWEDRSTAVLFGDGAGAVTVERVPAPYGFESVVLGADGSGGETPALEGHRPPLARRHAHDRPPLPERPRGL